MQVVRRDFINLAAVVMCALDLYWLVYGTMAVGGVVTAFVIVPEHMRLRRQLRELARRGGQAQLLPAA
jgi:hypothetical protein